MSPAPAEDRRGPLWVGTSWKMTKTLAEAAAFVARVRDVAVPPGIQPFLLPAHTALAHVRDRLPPGSPILLGAQNASAEPEGAGTGEVSMRMVADAGARLVEIGHSERRAAFGETDATVAAKTAAALARGLVPLVCVGEPLEVREAGDATAFVAAQVWAALAGVAAAEVDAVLIAYEPIWAIGERGRPATVAETAPVMARIAEVVAEVADGRRARAVLYGGGVDPENAEELLGDPSTGGLFVGRAGWDPDGFLDLIQLAAPFAAGRDPVDPQLHHPDPLPVGPDRQEAT